MPADKDRAQQAYAKLSEKSRRDRFWKNNMHLSPEDAATLTDTDDNNHIGWIALPVDEDSEIPGYGAASFWRNPSAPEEAEFSITVLDEWQGRGFSNLLLSVLWWEAYALDIRTFSAITHSSTETFSHWWNRLGGQSNANARQMELPLEAPLNYANRIEFDLHAAGAAFEVASWFRHWDKITG